MIQLFAFKYKSQTFLRVCLRFITSRLPFKVYCLKIIKTEPVYPCKQWRRQVSEFGGAFGGGQHAFWGGKIEFHEISPPPRCPFFPYIFSEIFSRTFLIFFQTFKICLSLPKFFTDLPILPILATFHKFLQFWIYPTQMFQQHLAIFHKSRPSAGVFPTPMALSD